MKKITYETYTFDSFPVWDEVKEGSLDFSNWDSETHYNTFFKMCFVKNKGIFLKMRTDETKLRCVNTKRDESIWEDSCMEFFICPFENRREYLNFEMNPLGAYLCQYGKERENRVFVKNLTSVEAEIRTETSENGWSLELFIPVKMISEIFGESFRAQACILKGNFYKCGDLTEKVHYDSFSKMTTLPPGFHNPDCFAEIIISER